MVKRASLSNPGMQSNRLQLPLRPGEASTCEDCKEQPCTLEVTGIPGRLSVKFCDGCARWLAEDLHTTAKGAA